MKALIIDDEIDICFLLAGILKKKDILTLYVNNIADAVVAMQQFHPELVFLDNHLPDGLGIDFAILLKANHPLLKIIMITAHDTTADRQLAMERGVDIFIGKPFTKEAINAATDSLIDQLFVPHL